MNADVAFLQMTGLLAAEVGAVILIAMVSERFVASAHWRRTLWQVCLLSVLLVTLLELSGAARGAGDLVRFSKQARPAIDEQSRAREQAAVTQVEPIVSLPISVASPGSVVETPAASIEAAAPLGPARGNSHHALLALACAWILGTGVFLCRAALSRAMLFLIFRTGSPVASDTLVRIAQDLAQRLRIHGKVRMIESRRLKGPIAFGLVRKMIGLPPGFESQHSRAQQEVILAHELAHLAARDNWWQLLTEIVVATLWWHPLVWLARRRLQDASETAADEASLLIQNGPPVLAECLLALGKRLEAKPGFGWLNIGGRGFRSGLGRRVQRLVELSGAAWNPPGRVRTGLARMFCPVAIVLVTVLCSGWLSSEATAKGTEMKNPMWKRSLPAFVMLAFLGAEQPGAAAEKPTPPTTAVKRSEAKPGRVQKGKGAAMVRRKLEQIVFSNFQSDNLPLGHVINSLIVEAEKRDPEGVGVNLLLQFHTEQQQQPAIDPATGLPIPGTAPEPVDLNAVTVRIMPPIKNVRLIDVLDAIVKMADRPLKYSTEEFGVLITLATKRQSEPALETRTFQITPPDKFYRGLESAFGIDVPGLDPSGVRSRETQQQVFQELFQQLGIEWGAPRSIFFNELNGIVMVRTAREDMALITAAMQTLGGFPVSDQISASPNQVAR